MEGKEGGRQKRPLHHKHPSLSGHRGEDPAAGWALEGEPNTGKCGKQHPGLSRTDPQASGSTRLRPPQRSPQRPQQYAGPQFPQRRYPPAPSPRRPGPAARSPRPVKPRRVRPRSSDHRTSGPAGPGRPLAHGHGPRQGPRREGRAPGRRRGLTFCRI